MYNFYNLFVFTLDTHLVDQDTSNHEINPWTSAEKEFGIKKNPFKKTGYK